MSGKTLYYIGAFLGSIVGGYIPGLWGAAGLLSVWSLVFSTLGAIFGIVIVYKTQN